MLKWGSVDPSKACQVGGKWPRVDKDRITRILSSFKTFFFLVTSAAVSTSHLSNVAASLLFLFFSWQSFSPLLISFINP